MEKSIRFNIGANNGFLPILQVVFMNLIRYVCSEITFLRLIPNLPGAVSLIIYYLVNIDDNVVPWYSLNTITALNYKGLKRWLPNAFKRIKPPL